MQGVEMYPAVEFRQLRYFLAVAKELHFTRAADRLHLTQSALTRQIQQLERDLHVELFVRNTRRVELTDAGRVLQGEAERILQEIDRAIQLARGAGRTKEKQVRFGYSPFLDLHLVSEIRTLFHDCRPEVPVTFVSSPTLTQISALLEGGIHAGLVTLPVTDDALKTECLFREPLLVALLKTHRLARKRGIRAVELTGEPIIWVPSAMHPAFFARFSEWCMEIGFRPQVVQEVTTVPELLEFVQEGLGLTFVNAAATKLRVEGVVFRPLVNPPFFVETGIAYRKDLRSETVAGLLAALHRKFPCGPT